MCLGAATKLVIQDIRCEQSYVFIRKKAAEQASAALAYWSEFCLGFIAATHR